jgi:transcriptional regulator with XRE-family HTH domain
MSQEDLANASSLDRSYMGGLERGEHNPTLMTVLRLANTLGVKASILLSESGL